MLQFEFIRPGFLLLIVPMAVVLGIGFGKSLSDFPRSQRIVSLVTRSLLALMMVLALAGLTWRHQTDEQFVLFVVDQSRSVGENARTAAADFLIVVAANQQRALEVLSLDICRTVCICCVSRRPRATVQ